ncbi:MAG: NERD domain-containing protein [Streptosporangiales bacterium]|nr:NERD domain-containing protein [Streptosporangiales bacterium]
MKVEVLSEHPADMVTDAEGERRHTVQTQLAVVTKLRAERRRVLLEGRLLTWVRMGSALRDAKRSAVRVQLSSALPRSGEQAAKAGQNAERRVAGQLGAVLDDSWTLFRGYCTARGELDALLVGPLGAFAIEEKYWSVRLWIQGDTWTAQKVSRQGEAHGARFPFQDGGGRSPARQVSEPASAVAGWLRRNGQEIRVTPVVLLSHPSARIVSLERPTVRVERSVSRLVAFIEDSGSPLDPSQAAEAERLVRRDHAFNAGKKASHA